MFNLLAARLSKFTILVVQVLALMLQLLLSIQVPRPGPQKVYSKMGLEMLLCPPAMLQLSHGLKRRWKGTRLLTKAFSLSRTFSTMILRILGTDFAKHVEPVFNVERLRRPDVVGG